MAKRKEINRFQRGSTKGHFIGSSRFQPFRLGDRHFLAFGANLPPRRASVSECTEKGPICSSVQVIWTKAALIVAPQEAAWASQVDGNRTKKRETFKGTTDIRY